MRRPAIVIVTFKRQELLAQLFESIKKLTVPAWRVVVVDNENSPRTAQMAASFAAELDAAWGPTTDDPDAEGGTSRLEYVPMEENTGGAGGFSAGVGRAFELGAEWFWVMDDDVAVEPDARRHGVASALLDVFCRFGAANLAFLTLEVRASNAPAIALYEKHGFAQAGLRKNYYEKPREDAVIMTRFFKEDPAVQA